MNVQLALDYVTLASRQKRMHVLNCELCTLACQASAPKLICSRGWAHVRRTQKVMAIARYYLKVR